MSYKFRDGVNCIVYRNINKKREFLILHRIKNWSGWEFPKGGIKSEESYRDTLTRELKEECGIELNNIHLILPTDSSLHIDYPKKLWKNAGFRGASYKTFLVEVAPKTRCTVKKNTEPEHDRIEWISKAEAPKYLDPKLVKVLNDSSSKLSELI